MAVGAIPVLLSNSVTSTVGRVEGALLSLVAVTDVGLAELVPAGVDTFCEGSVGECELITGCVEDSMNGVRVGAVLRRDVAAEVSKVVRLAVAALVGRMDGTRDGGWVPVSTLLGMLLGPLLSLVLPYM